MHIERSGKIMKSLVLLLAVTSLLASCGTHRQCAQICASLCAVKPDSQGYLPRDALFQAAGVPDPYFSPSMFTSGKGSVTLPCGCVMVFSERSRSPTGRPERNRPPKGEVVSIDQILNNPNRTANLPEMQLDSVTLVEKSGRVFCRIETTEEHNRRTGADAILPDPNKPRMASR